MRSVKAAASLTADEIFEDVESSGHRDALAQLQEIWIVRSIVFVVGTVPQIVKLYAMIGIRATQTCASLYFGSFVAIEMIMVWLKRYRSSSPLQSQSNHGSRPTIYENLRTAAFFATILLLGSAFSDISLVGIVSIWPSVSFLFLPLWLVGLPLWTSRKVLQFTFSIITLLLSLLGVLVWAAIDARATKKFSDTALVDILQGSQEGKMKFLLQLLCVLLSFIPVCYAHYLGTQSTFRTMPNMQYCASITFMLYHLVAAILLYIFLYDPRETYKPDWANKLP